MATIQLTTEGFKTKVFDYDVDREWRYKGTVPAIIDFYADWCGPCRMVGPVLEELSEQYKGELVIYKVNAETEGALASKFGIRGIPTLLFIPVNGAPMMHTGAPPRKALQQIIEKKLIQREVHD